MRTIVSGLVECGFSRRQTEDQPTMARIHGLESENIAEKYAVLIDALYSSKPSQYIETQVKFEDGRKGMVSADLQIRDMKTFTAMKKAA